MMSASAGGEPQRKKYVRAVGPRLRVLLYVVFALFAVLGANSVYLASITFLEWWRGLTYQNYFYMVMFGAHLVLGLLIVLPVIVFGALHIKNAHDRPNRRAVKVGYLLFAISLILLFTGLPFMGLELGGFACVAVAFMLNNSAYYGEILRAGIDSVPHGQIEAARSTGLSGTQAMVHVVLPQAIRNVLPDLLSNTLEVVKLTSLGSVVAVPELLYQARQAQSATFNPTPIVMAAVIYFLLLWPLVRLLSRLENRALMGRG